jgi:hypothetical protein
LLLGVEEEQCDVALQELLGQALQRRPEPLQEAPQSRAVGRLQRRLEVVQRQRSGEGAEPL